MESAPDKLRVLGLVSPELCLWEAFDPLRFTIGVDRTSVGEDQFSPSFDLHQNFRFWDHYSFVRGIVFACLQN